MDCSRRYFVKTTLVSGAGAVFVPGVFGGIRKKKEIVMKHYLLRNSAENKYRLDLGLGFNWFEHLGSGGHYARWIKYPLSDIVYPDMDDKAGWKAIKQGLDELSPGWFRFGMPPDPHVDDQGNFFGNTVHFKHLEWLNSWAVKNDRTILLDMFLMPRYYEFPVPEGTEDPGNNIVNMAAANNRAYAKKFVAPMMEHVVKRLKLKSVRLFNPINEPMEYGVYQTPGNHPPAMAHYVDMYREIRNALDAVGIDRERVGLIGLDCGDPAKFTLEQHALGVDIDPYVDAYSVHHYNLRLDHVPPLNLPDTGPHYFVKGMNVVIEQDDRKFLDYTRFRNKPLWALEMGTFYYGKFATPEGVASLDATITVAEGIIRAINAGITSFCIWSLMNPNTVDGHWAVMGERNGQLVRHAYPFAVYGLLANHFGPGDGVFPLIIPDAPEICHLHATALENPEGRKTLLLVNDHHEQDAEVELELPESWPRQGKYQISIASHSALNVVTGEVIAEEGILRLNCPPFSLIGLKYISSRHFLRGGGSKKKE